MLTVEGGVEVDTLEKRVTISRWVVWTVHESVRFVRMHSRVQTMKGTRVVTEIFEVNAVMYR